MHCAALSGHCLFRWTGHSARHVSITAPTCLRESKLHSCQYYSLLDKSLMLRIKEQDWPAFSYLLLCSDVTAASATVAINGSQRLQVSHLVAQTSQIIGEIFVDTVREVVSASETESVQHNPVKKPLK